jgi:hypothetical protein
MKDFLERRALYVADQTLNYATMDFPLGMVQIQQALMSDDLMEHAKALKRAQITTFMEQTCIHVRFGRDILPELRRGAVIRLQLPVPVVAKRDTSLFYMSPHDPSPFSNRTPRNVLLPDFAEHPLGTETRADLVKWLNRVIRQQRLRDLTVGTANLLLRVHAKSCAHLRAVWPTLCSLADDVKGTNYRTHYKQDQEFVERLRDDLRAVHRNLDMYKPPPSVVETYGKKISVADTVLVAGLLLAPLDEDTTRPVATLAAWEKIEGDTV